MRADPLIDDEAFDAGERVLEPLSAAGKAAVIPAKANRVPPRDFDRDPHKARHLIETFFAKLKRFGAIATRDGKTARHLFGGVHLAATEIWLD